MALTLRYLAISYRMRKSTVSAIIKECCDAIYKVLIDIYLVPPGTNDWVAIIHDFEELWNLPNVIGALDGKHIRITCPPKIGTQFHKKIFKSAVSCNV